MKIRLSELAARIGAEIARGGAASELAGVSNLADAGPDQLAPFTDPQYLAQLKATKAGAILIKRGADIADVPAGAAVLVCGDPEMAFLEAIRQFNPPVARAAGIHPTAIVEAGVEIGAGCHIGPHVFIESGTRVGQRCSILANSVIGPDCVIGDDCFINANVTLYRACKLGRNVILHSGVVLGADGFGYKFRSGRYVKVPHVGWVELGDDVEVGANTCIDCGALGPTRIGAGTKIDNLVQIAHNNSIGKHCILCGQVAMAGSCTLEDYVVLGGQTGVADHTYVETGLRAGAKSGLAGRVPGGQEVWGYFYSERSVAVRSYAALRQLPELMRRVKALERKV